MQPLFRRWGQRDRHRLWLPVHHPSWCAAFRRRARPVLRQAGHRRLDGVQQMCLIVVNPHPALHGQDHRDGEEFAAVPHWKGRADNGRRVVLFRKGHIGVQMRKKSLILFRVDFTLTSAQPFLGNTERVTDVRSNRGHHRVKKEITAPRPR